jgi:hypothetical protein
MLPTPFASWAAVVVAGGGALEQPASTMADVAKAKWMIFMTLEAIYTSSLREEVI